jgi:hypothetical protein
MIGRIAERIQAHYGELLGWDLLRLAIFVLLAAAAAMVVLSRRRIAGHPAPRLAAVVAAAGAVGAAALMRPGSTAALALAAAGVALAAVADRRAVFAVVGAAALLCTGLHLAWNEAADQRALVLEEMRRRPGDAWPRGAGHALLGAFDAPVAARAWVEAGGSFSPGLRSFGLSIWVVRDADGARVAGSDDIAIGQTRHRFGRTPEGLPTLTVTTPYYVARWIVEGVDAYALVLEDRTDERSALEVVLRSVGPAGGPVTRIAAGEGALSINGRWRVSAPGAKLVGLGDELAGGLQQRAATGSIEARDGWGYARLRPPGPTSRFAITQPGRPVAAASALPQRDGCALQGFPASFTELLAANETNLLLGLVDGETRPGDPVSYPLAWQRDGAYVVVALARCGQARAARQLAGMLARQDFFGGFGAEADAPGLALWALGEVSQALGDPAFDAEVWPHVRRKVGLIRELLTADREVRHRFSGPVVPKWRRHPESDLVAEPARRGLIEGRMDWERPVFFVNAAAHLGLVSAAELAARLGQAESRSWSAMAGALLCAYRQLMAELPPDARELRNERTTINALYPTEAAEPQVVRRLLERQWRAERRDDGAFRAAPQWTYFAVAQAHQWLRLGEPQKAWTTLEWFAAHDRLPGLWVFWEGRGEENRFGLWNDVRGNVAPRGVTPHYWTSAEAQLLAVEMLAFAERARRRIVIGAGAPAQWLAGPLAVERVGTALGPVSWSYDGKGRVRVSAPEGLEVVLGAAFPRGTAIERVSYAPPAPHRRR